MSFSLEFSIGEGRPKTNMNMFIFGPLRSSKGSSVQNRLWQKEREIGSHTG